MSVMSNQGERRETETEHSCRWVFLVAGGLPGIAHIKSAHYELQTFARAQTIFLIVKFGTTRTASKRELSGDVTSCLHQAAQC